LSSITKAKKKTGELGRAIPRNISPSAGGVLRKKGEKKKGPKWLRASVEHKSDIVAGIQETTSAKKETKVTGNKSGGSCWACLPGRQEAVERGAIVAWWGKKKIVGKGIEAKDRAKFPEGKYYQRRGEAKEEKPSKKFRGPTGLYKKVGFLESPKTKGARNVRTKGREEEQGLR